MARPIRIDDEALLDAARQVFLEKGISATTAEIAARAGVAEGTLFHRFGNKTALFNAAMRPQAGQVLEPLDLKRRVGKGDLRQSMLEIQGALIDFVRKMLPQVMMSWSNRAEASGLPDIFKAKDPAPLRVVRELSAYFAAEICAGRLRAVEPDVLARAFVAGAVHFVFIETLGGYHGQKPLPQTTYVRGLIDMLLAGVLPDAARKQAGPRVARQRAGAAAERIKSVSGAGRVRKAKPEQAPQRRKLR